MPFLNGSRNQSCANCLPTAPQNICSLTKVGVGVGESGCNVVLRLGQVRWWLTNIDSSARHWGAWLIQTLRGLAGMPVMEIGITGPVLDVLVHCLGISICSGDQMQKHSGRHHGRFGRNLVPNDCSPKKEGVHLDATYRGLFPLSNVKDQYQAYLTSRLSTG